MVENPESGIRYFLVKPSDVCVYVERGAADIGIVGKDILEESWDVSDEFLSEFGIQKSWLTRFPQELSGGELQRFSVLRSLNPNTKFLIADEMKHTKKTLDEVLNGEITALSLILRFVRT